MKEEEFTQSSFVKTYILPLFLIFLIPAFSLWFFNHARDAYDQRILKGINQSIDHAAELSQEEKMLEKAFYKQALVSKVLASTNPELQELRNHFSVYKNDYLQFSICILISKICLFSSLAALIIVLICVAFSFKSQKIQFQSLFCSWHLLKILSVIHVLGQGILAVGLSYWITIIWMDSYIPKLIIAIGILVLLAIGLLIKAVFTSIDDKFVIEGAIVDLEKSPELKHRLQEICKEFKISVPDQIIGGVDDNFFVTEQPVIVKNKTYYGKTLYVSLSLLKTLEKEESEAIISHEMAHFSGKDTLFSKKISPVMAKYHHYLNALHEGGITLPIFYFMLFFWSLFQISLSKLSREREFRADKLASQITSPQAMASSLAKVNAYAHYRNKLELDIFNKDRITEKINISDKVLTGFPAFLEKVKLKEEVFESSTPHPFDSHPSFNERLKNVGLEDSYVNKDLLGKPVQESWYSQIHNAQEIETEMWDKYEDEFNAAHEQILCYKVEPKEEWEIEVVEKFFPLKKIKGKKGKDVTIDYEKISFSDWENDIYFKDIDEWTFEEHLGGHRLMFKLKKAKGKIYLKTAKFVISEQEFLDTFYYYYSRYLAYLEHLQEKSSKVSIEQK